MSVYFSADEIFEMDEKIERNGVIFYRAAAEKAGASENKKLLDELAAMETEHEQVFAAMREALTPKEQAPTVFDPEGQMGQYLRSMADGKVFEVRADPTAIFTGEESMADILRAAIEKEKDSIIFYLGMKEMVKEGWGKDRIDRIIKEEMSHIGALSMELAAMK